VIELLRTLVFLLLGAMIVARWLRRLDRLDPAEAYGLGGLLTMALIGWLSFWVLLWNSVLVQWFPLGLLLLYPIFCRSRDHLDTVRFQLPKGPIRLALIPIFLAVGMGCVAAVAPSTAMDWDSLAYHLAVPKLWLDAGRMFYIPHIHHSNFPFLIDNLFVWRESASHIGSKAVTVAGFGFGLIWLFGVARRGWGGQAGWWASMLFAGVPVVLWESGTAYIDGVHGLFAAGGVIYALQAVLQARNGDPARPLWVLSALMLGAALGSKYTGLQTWALSGVVILVLALRFVPTEHRKHWVRGVALVGLGSALIASPWYVRNALNTGNPVYPFFYEQLGGRDWDQRRADIYKNEQQTFGVGRTAEGRDVLQMPHAVLGLAYQPGRYVNPGQTAGLGYPVGAVGWSLLAVLVLAALNRRRGDLWSGGLLAVVGLSLVAWFFLSQQSRYIASLAPLVALLIGSIRSPAGVRLAAVVIPLQLVATLVTQSKWVTQDQLPVVFGNESRADYVRKRVPFAEAAETIHQKVPSTGRVALYDEVFGVFLNVPYVWANPGHSTRIPYDEMQNEQDFARIMQEQGFTHVYLNFQWQDRGFLNRWLGAMGVLGSVTPLPPDERAALMANWEVKWKVLVAEAVARGELIEVARFRSGMLFAFRADAS